MKAAPSSPGRSRWTIGSGALTLAVLLLIPLAEARGNLIRLLFGTFLWVTTSLAWNLLGGVTGQVSFGFAVFYGLGAYISAFAINAGINPYAAFLAGGLASAVGSILVGIPAFRLRGPYFAIATIGASYTDGMRRKSRSWWWV